MFRKKMFVVVLVLSGLLINFILLDYFEDEIEEYLEYRDMGHNMNHSQQITQGIVTGFECDNVYYYGVAINGDWKHFNLATSNPPSFELNKTYTIYWQWEVMPYGYGGGYNGGKYCVYSKYVDYILDKNGIIVYYG